MAMALRLREWPEVDALSSLRNSQSLIERSTPAEMMCRPSLEKATEPIHSSCPRRLRISARVCRLQTLTTASLPPAVTNLPSGLKASELTGPPCPSSSICRLGAVGVGVVDSRLQIFTL